MFSLNKFNILFYSGLKALNGPGLPLTVQYYHLMNLAKPPFLNQYDVLKKLRERRCNLHCWKTTVGLNGKQLKVQSKNHQCRMAMMRVMGFTRTKHTTKKSSKPDLNKPSRSRYQKNQQEAPFSVVMGDVIFAVYKWSHFPSLTIAKYKSKPIQKSWILTVQVLKNLRVGLSRHASDTLACLFVCQFHKVLGTSFASTYCQNVHVFGLLYLELPSERIREIIRQRSTLDVILSALGGYS